MFPGEGPEMDIPADIWALCFLFAVEKWETQRQTGLPLTFLRFGSFWVSFVSFINEDR
jgi:hypothetical protein